jgi:signal transduction histidine kinase
VTVRTSPADGCVRVEVQDSGPGVPAKERDHLFRKPGRLSPRPTAGEESTGHGLTIVKQLVESQGGRVGAHFPEPSGSIFWFELPVVS